MDEEKLTMLKPQENAEAELWLQREKMRKMWQTWQEGVESVIDKNSALQSFSNKKTNKKQSYFQVGAYIADETSCLALQNLYKGP